MATQLCGKVCGFLAIHTTEIASKNHPRAGTRAYDYPYALLMCQMALEIPEVGTYVHVYIPTHVFVLVACKNTSKNTPHHYLCFFFVKSLSHTVIP